MKLSFKDVFNSKTPFNVEENGRATFTNQQWRFLLKLAGSKAKTFRAQQRVIKKLISEAIKKGLKAVETNSNS